MTESYQTIINIPVYKKYTVKRIPFRNSIYKDNVDWLAQWFYNNIENNTDNILIEITGDLHQTFPNPPHLSVRFKYNDFATAMYHMSVDQNGYVFAQSLNTHMKGKSKKKKGKSKKKKKSKKSKKK